ncbi:MAG TPA: hypothetical protein VMB71_08765 [Acetobacteraceae bacterium]|nr:hypothetical protein [Acetobacteraceae bacterium]
MPGDFAIGPVSAAQPLPLTRGNAFTAEAENTGGNAAGSTTIGGPPPVNPGLHLDPALNLVVLQFFDSEGNVTQSIPSQRQLQAYRQGDATPPGATGNAAKNEQPG